MSSAFSDSPPLFPLKDGPDFDLEERLFKRGKEVVAGVDEAGRGPLAGPVVAAAVILDPKNIPTGLNDSKKLTETKRETLFDEILSAAEVGIASVSARRIDEINILAASLEAMEHAVAALTTTLDHCLIDGNKVPAGLMERADAIVKGDARSLSIAAASIIAKVTRDRMMIHAASVWPAYGFEAHKGYGTKVHMAALREHGPCPIHRISFAPLAASAHP
ncbi:MAG: ribonuclease HII [Pseudomonadota bacterium]